ncbi:MAG: hypothetical protein V2J07_06885 [Anaerolineae bacterium]|jgi:hypothetical protein|nr:hypothetical protein [Anaerolineae bacterium]
MIFTVPSSIGSGERSRSVYLVSGEKVGALVIDSARQSYVKFYEFGTLPAHYLSMDYRTGRPGFDIHDEEGYSIGMIDVNDRLVFYPS